MRSLGLYTQYLFHPVGQGLFASGHISRSPYDAAPAFTWVYDCGSVSSAALVRAGLERLREHSRRGRRTIDLVVLSHFDKDHISGVTELLSSFAVDTLVIPLVPWWQRVGTVFAKDRYIDKRALRFYLDPVAAVASIPGAEITRIIVVPPSAGDNSPPQGVSDDPVPLPSTQDRSGQRQGLELLTSSGLTRVAQEMESSKDLQGGPPVYQLPVGATLIVAGGFEFVPYNDARLPKRPDDAFIREANVRANALLDSSSVSGRTATLKALKRHFDSTYKSARQRNEISLYLYAGPTSETSWCACNRARKGPSNYQRAHFFGRGKRGGVLYTGDAYLEVPEKWHRLEKYLSRSRVDRLLSFQVMHHGASANWHAGLAAAVRSPYAVFSSDPSHKRFRHPHNVVVRDFQGISQPVFVNREQGLSLAMVA
jgi:hypothetical protein